MLRLTPQGLYCETGNFFIDPKGRVENAVVTHSHSDHARRGAGRYFTARSGVSLLRCRLGQSIQVKGIAYGEPFHLGPVKVSFHPAGHILGSAQVRMEHDGEVWLASGDYKREPDPSCEPFEVVKADVFVTEATFGTKAYRWDREKNLGEEIHAWWRANEEEGVNSLIFAYSLGKTQRILAELMGERAIFTAPAATALVECYRQEGVRLAPTRCLSELGPKDRLRGELILAPQSLL
jgi:putative mRNA 3-end processing factor